MEDKRGPDRGLASRANLNFQYPLRGGGLTLPPSSETRRLIRQLVRFRLWMEAKCGLDDGSL